MDNFYFFYVLGYPRKDGYDQANPSIVKVLQLLTSMEYGVLKKD